jgi:hypothetical protein
MKMLFRCTIIMIKSNLFVSVFNLKSMRLGYSISWKRKRKQRPTADLEYVPPLFYLL